jgi:hypothetical protein
MQFTASTLFAATSAAPNAAALPNPIAAPAAQTVQTKPATTKATMIKHIAYKCKANANAAQCASAKNQLFAKELKGCDVLGKPALFCSSSSSH